jgi:hypothetical protein
MVVGGQKKEKYREQRCIENITMKSRSNQKRNIMVTNK